MRNRFRAGAIENAAVVDKNEVEWVHVHDLAGEVQICGIGVRRIALRICPDRIARHVAGVIAEQNLAIWPGGDFGLTVWRQSLLQLIDRIDNAVVSAGINLYVILRHHIAVHDDVAKNVLIMRAAVVTLLRVGGDD